MLTGWRVRASLPWAVALGMTVAVVGAAAFRGNLAFWQRRAPAALEPEVSFAWIGGSNRTAYQSMYPFTDGSDPSLNYPGERVGSISWFDSNKLYLFGGYSDGGNGGSGDQGSKNDLWAFDLSNSTWSWIKGPQTWQDSGYYGTKGVSDSSNVPPARSDATTWRTSDGRLWLFGGDAGYSYSHFSDLWAYDPSSGDWTWVSGSDQSEDPGNYGPVGVEGAAYFPFSRSLGASWLDGSGRLFLFGGAKDNDNQLYLSDMWRFDPATSKWALISGSSTNNQSGVYGALGVASSSNVPGARANSCVWQVSSGTVFMFGGQGIDATGNVGALSDLWQWSPTTEQWTWIAGSNAVDEAPVFGTLGVSSGTTTPGAREAAVCEIDSSGRLWLFGGYGSYSSGTPRRGDAWFFDVTSLQWTWAKGSDQPGPTGVYGTVGIPGSSNSPGGRARSSAWMDSTGGFWIFGGEGKDGVMTGGNYGNLGDLWRLDTVTRDWTWVAGYSTTYRPGVSVGSGVPNSLNWPGARELPVTWSASGGTLWMYAGSGVDRQGNMSSLTDLWRYSIASGQWTLIADFGGESTGTMGVESAANSPGPLTQTPAWIDANGDLWLLNNSGRTWRYRISTGHWTWMSGTGSGSEVRGARGVPSVSNQPVARSASAFFKDASGDFWIFGGGGYSSYDNDLWKFSPTTLEWTWVAGSGVKNSYGVYGTLGVAAGSIAPGSRTDTAGLIDASGSVWVYGGEGYAQSGFAWVLNDLWKYDSTADMWSWRGGAKTTGGGGVSGTPLLPGSSYPGGAAKATAWLDASGKAWVLTSGIGLYASRIYKLNLSNDQWALMKDLSDPVYGTKGVSATANAPGIGFGRAIWHQPGGATWFFGGKAIDSQNRYGLSDELWRMD